MAALEEEIIKESEYKPYLRWRYIDDIFFLCKNKLTFFIDKINKVHPTIKFTAKWSKTSINFLDVTVYLIEELTETDLHVEPTDISIYNLALYNLIVHPFHYKKGILYSQALMLHCICSEINSFDKRYNDLETFVLEKGYSSKLVGKEIIWARKILAINC